MLGYTNLEPKRLCSSRDFKRCRHSDKLEELGIQEMRYGSDARHPLIIISKRDPMKELKVSREHI